MKMIPIAVAISLFIQSASAQVYIKPSNRVRNWGYHGSCVHAATATALFNVGAYQTGNYILRNYRGGEACGILDSRLRGWGISTAATHTGDRAVLDYAHRNRLTAIITYHHNHVCLFLGWNVDAAGNITHAYVLNNNHVRRPETPSYQRFMANWRRNDGEAIVIIKRSER